jgi:hypothetical protein
MVLPLIGSFLGSAFLPTVFSGMSPLVAGAVGSGLGSLAQGDSLGDAITTGFTSFLGGKLLSGFGSDAAKAARFDEVTKALPEGVGMEMTGSGSMFNPKAVGFDAETLGTIGKEGGLGVMDAGMQLAKANPMAAAGLAGGTMLAEASKAQPTGMPDPYADYQRTETMPYQQNPQFPGGPSMSGQEFNYGFYNPSAAQLQTQVLNTGGIVSNAGSNYENIMKRRKEVNKMYMGGSPFQMMGQALASRIQQEGMQRVGPFVEEVEGMARERFGEDIVGQPAQGQGIKGGAGPRIMSPRSFTPTMVRPSVMIPQGTTDEQSSAAAQAYKRDFGGKGGSNAFGGGTRQKLMAAMMAEGGEVKPTSAEQQMLGGNEKDIIVNAVNAVKGNLPEEQASIALAMFVQQYGEDALRQLVSDTQEGKFDGIGGKADGMVEGGGDGMSDSVPATIDGQEDLLVSRDEYVIDAPTVAMIGNGSSEAGADKLDKMREDVRKAATGSSIQPKQIDAEEVMSRAIA